MRDTLPNTGQPRIPHSEYVTAWDESGYFFIQYRHGCNGFRGYHLRHSLGAGLYDKGGGEEAREARLFLRVCGDVCSYLRSQSE